MRVTNSTSMTEETVVVKSLQLPEVRTAYLVGETRTDIEGKATEIKLEERITYRREAPPPPPRRVSLLKYEDGNAST